MPQLLSIQYLRAVAALLVLVFHARLQLDRLALPAGGTDWMAAGVDVFFVISGLIMWITTTVQPIGPVTFWWRRLVRIAPLYWLLTSAMVAVALIAPNLLRSARFDAAHVAASYLFIPWMHPLLAEPMPILVPGWTLNYEMGFYLLFGLLLTLPARARFWGMGVLLGALVLAAWLVAEPGMALRFYGADLVLEFWFGMALGRLVMARRLPGAAVSTAMLVLGFAALPLGWDLVGELSRGLALGPPAVLVVLGALGLEAAGKVPAWRLPLRLGDASYALYLVHVVLLAAASEAWRRVWPWGGLASSILFVLASAVAACVAALILHHLVELPLRRAMRGHAVPDVAAQARAV